MADPRSVSMRNTNTLDYNISDIIDVIKEDYQDLETEYGGAVVGSAIGSADNYSVVTQESCNDPDYALKRKAYVKILEQPQAKALRFRYMCEGRSAGSIPGVRSTADNKTFPGIQVVGYKGPAVVVVSCVTVDPPYRPHPHNLVGKEGCKKGICTMTISSDTMQCMFSNLGIQCIKKRDVEDALKLREEIRVDPFQTGFSHRNQPQSIDLNSLRLCFQVFLEGSEKGKFTFPLKPVVSDPIYDKKAACDLNICKLSDCTSSVAGGKEIILLCEKVTKEDIQVRFYEVKDGRIEWEAFGDFQASDVHKQVAISFKTPRYKTLEVENPVKVFVQLLRPTDKSTSEPRNFHFLPLDSGRPFTSFKRLKNNYGLFQRILGLDSPASIAASGEDTLRRKLPSQSPRSPDVIDVLAEDAKPKPPTELKLPGFPVTALQAPVRPPPATSPPLLSQAKPGSPPAAASSAILARQSSSPPLLMSPDQSVDDIRQRLTATLERRKTGATSPKASAGPPRPSPFWSDDTSVYSDTDMLDEVLSQGSVNDLLSAVGEGFTVYEDITEPLDSSNNNALQPDAVYGDASYASCYSNLEFVMGQARAASAGGSTASLVSASDSPAKLEVPALPPKKNPRGSVVQPEEDFGIYGTPSGQPIHANKAALLLERGFTVAANSNQNPTNNQSVDNILYYDPGGNDPQGGASECGDLEDMWDEVSNQTRECTNEQLPRTVLDLFV
ncbi:transcription factor p65-like isoform X1 [Macrobrachium rosenbergii]|uniref:transcription factor p65-like isoform X1 n=1 Tax=Macrobrachium rosenbergii TaxID=79674 RepID=UPI0034D680FA